MTPRSAVNPTGVTSEDQVVEIGVEIRCISEHPDSGVEGQIVERPVVDVLIRREADEAVPERHPGHIRVRNGSPHDRSLVVIRGCAIPYSTETCGLVRLSRYALPGRALRKKHRYRRRDRIKRSDVRTLPPHRARSRSGIASHPAENHVWRRRTAS